MCNCFTAASSTHRISVSLRHHIKSVCLLTRLALPRTSKEIQNAWPLCRVTGEMLPHQLLLVYDAADLGVVCLYLNGVCRYFMSVCFDVLSPAHSLLHTLRGSSQEMLTIWRLVGLWGSWRRWGLSTVQITFIFIDFRVCDFAFAFKTQNAPCVSRFKRVLFSDRFQFAF